MRYPYNINRDNEYVDNVHIALMGETRKSISSNVCNYCQLTNAKRKRIAKLGKYTTRSVTG